MPFTQKIYFNDKPLILTTDALTYQYSNPIAAGYLKLTGAFPRSFRLASAHLSRPKALGAIIEDANQKYLEEELHALYEPVDAGGGVVENERGEILMIYRRGRWDLPKGKRDDGEEIAACALREVEEETGLKNVKLGEKICDTWHVYTQKNQSLLKQTSWYKMESHSAMPLLPQASENILEAKWIAPSAMAHFTMNTYEAIREVLHHLKP